MPQGATKCGMRATHRVSTHRVTYAMLAGIVIDRHVVQDLTSLFQKFLIQIGVEMGKIWTWLISRFTFEI